MKKVFFLFAILCSLSTATFAQNGITLEGLSIKSAILGREMKYSVYLPFDYKTSNRNYPILYMLHGLGDDDSGWIQFGEIAFYADKAIASGTTSPMVIIMPDGLRSFYVNSADGKTKYQDYFLKELMPAVENIYRIRKSQRFRAIAGLSMGGYGALNYAIKRPDLFCAAAPLSAAVFTDDEIQNLDDNAYADLAANIYGSGLKAKNRINANNQQNSILKMIELTPTDSLKKVSWFFDCGDSDFLINGNMAIHAAFKNKGVNHDFKIRSGAHNWHYWRTAMPDVLKFLGDAFHK